MPVLTPMAPMRLRTSKRVTSKRVTRDDEAIVV
jgi:hypothetical protein